MDSATFILLERDQPRAGQDIVPGATLSGSGWAVANRPIAGIEIWLDDHRLGYAAYGLPREDIGLRYPHYPAAATSGFAFTVALPDHPAAASATLGLRALTDDGATAETRTRLVWASPAATPLCIAVETCCLDDGLLHLGCHIRAADPPSVQILLETEVLPPPDIARAPGGGYTVRLVCPAVASTGTLRIIARSGAVQRQLALPLGAPVPPMLLAAGSARIGIDGLARSGGTLLVSGWALGPAPITEIRLSAGPVSTPAETGLPRPDLGNRFPTLPHARLAGFHARLDIPPKVPVSLHVQEPDGSETTLAVPAPLQATAETPRLTLDLLQDGSLVLPPGQRLLTGYIVSPSSPGRLTLRDATTLLATATPTLRRHDAAEAYPFWPHALTGGFALMLPDTLPPGDHALTLTADPTSNAPGTVCAFILRLPAPPEPLRPRHRVPAAETALRQSLLDSLGPAPRVTVAILDGPDRRRTLDSLVRQTFPHWQALLLHTQGTASNPGQETDPRIITVPAGAVGGASFGTEGFAMLLHAGDVLAADALQQMLITARLTGAAFVYTDEWRHDSANGAPAAFRKPALSPEAQLSIDIAGRAWCASTATLHRAGVTPAHFAAHGAYDCALRVFEIAGTAQHLPDMLLEAAGLADPALEQAACVAACRRRGIVADIRPGRAPGTRRLHRPVPPVTVSVIIPTAGARGLIRRAVASLRATAGRDVEFVAVAHQGPSLTPLLPWLTESADRIVNVTGAFNWSDACNRGAAAASGTVLLFLNDDIEATEPGWLDALLEHALLPDVGAAGAQLLYPDFHLQHAGMMLRGPHGVHLFRHAPADWPGPFGLAQTAREVTAVTGACLMTRRDVFERLGRFNAAHDIVNNDLDYCLRAGAAGLRVVYTPYARLVHHELASRASLPDHFDKPAFDAAWQLRLLRGDALESPSLDRNGLFRAPDPEPLQWLQPGLLPYDPASIRAVLAVKLDHLGDFITSLPALAQLRASFPRALLVLLTTKANAGLAALAPVDAVETVDIDLARPGQPPRTLKPQTCAALTARLAPYRFDLAIDLRNFPDTREVLRHTGATWLAGYDRDGLFPWLDIALEWEGDPPLRGKRAPIGASLLRLAAATTLSPDATPDNWQPPGPDAPKYICIHPGAGTALKTWPEAAFAGLITLLLADYDVRIVVLGAADEASAAAALAARVNRPDRITRHPADAPLASLPTLLRGAVLFVGNDSFPKHLAASLGVPTLGLHAAHVDATEWAGLGRRAIMLRRRMSCGPCYLTDAASCPRGVACLRGITEAEAYRACRLLLGFSFGAGSAGPVSAAPPAA